jgi:hypothetical protein
LVVAYCEIDGDTSHPRIYHADGFGAKRREPTAMADVLHGTAELGAQHVVAEFAPYTPEALERFATVVEMVRQR